MTHQAIRELLSEYADQRLDPAQRAAFESHLEGCAACTRLARSFLAALDEMHAFPSLEVSPGFVQTVMDRTVRRPSPGGWLDRVIRSLRMPRLSPAAAMALLALPVLLFAGTPQGRSLGREMTRVSHRAYSEVVRLYYRSGDFRDTAVAVRQKLPDQIGSTVDWIRQRLGKPAPAVEEESNRPEDPKRDIRSGAGLEDSPRA
jgi:hypothetical protein